MPNLNTHKFVIHSRNGNVEEDDKFVEIDGNKFVPDDTDPSKAKVGEDGKPVPFVPKKKDDFKIDDLSNADLEALAKVNPKVAKLLQDQKDADKREADRKKEEEEKARKEAEAKGEWQKLADDERTKREKAEKERDEKNELLGKYAGTVQEILKNVLETIPKENQKLIPEKFSPREKLEYITANAKLLGAKIVGAGANGKAPTGDDIDGGTELAKAEARQAELIKKGKERTRAEDDEMISLGSKIKKLRAESKE